MTDIFDQSEVNFDEKQELAFTIARALQRREDQIIIDVLTGGTYGAAPAFDPDTGYDIPVGAAGLTVDKLAEAAMIGMTDRSVDVPDRTLVLTAGGAKQLLDQVEYTSSDFHTIKALVDAKVDKVTYMGFEMIVLDTREEGGLPNTAGVTAAYAYHKKALGYAVGIDMKTDIDWVPEKTSWLSNGLLKAGGVMRENRGVVRIGYDETVVIP